MEELFTIKEIEAKWKISYDTLHRAIRSKQLSCIKLGRFVRFKQEHIDDYLEKRTIQAKGKQKQHFQTKGQKRIKTKRLMQT